MMEALEKISRKKAEAHLRVRLDGDTGMGGSREVLNERERLKEMVGRGKEAELWD
jgi:hypothetical protein